MKGGQPSVRVTDAGIERIAAVVRRHPEYFQRSTELANSIEQLSFEPYGDRTLEPDEAEAPLLSWQAAIEERVRSLLSQDSRYYWFFLHRRLAGLRRHGQDARTELICDEFATLAIMQYAAKAGTRFCEVGAESLPRDWLEEDNPTPLPAVPRLIGMPAYQSVPQVILASRVRELLEVDALLKDYWSTTALLRRVWKGSKLVIAGSRVRRSLAPPTVERMITLYDRRSNHNDILSHVGLTASLAIKTASQVDSPKLAWAIRRNVDGADLPLGIMRLQLDGPSYRPPFAVLPVSLSEFIAQTEPFRIDIERATDVDPWRAACFFAALFWRFVFRCRDDLTLSAQYERVGYGVVNSRSGFLGDVAPYYEIALKSLGLDGDAEADIAHLASWLTYTSEPDIGLASRTGRRLFFDAPNGVVLDLGALPNVLAELARPIVNVDKAQGALKGALFEALVEGQIRRIPRTKVVFRNQDVHDPMSGRTIGEIDIGVVRSGTLFIIECKAHSVHESWERGTPASLAYRWATESSYLDNADRLARAISAGDTDLTIPEGVSNVIAMVVSPFASYIPDPDSHFFFTEDIPRLCTAEEAATFVHEFNLNRHRSASWLNAVVR